MAKEIRKVSTGYKPRPLQLVLHKSRRRFNVIVAHRRFGKSYFSLAELLDYTIRCPLRNPQYAYFSPTYKQAKRIAWQYLVDMTRDIPGAHPNKAELTIYIDRSWYVNPVTGRKDPDQAKIMLIGSDDPDDGRGIYLDGGILDEFAQCDPIIWGEIVRPALADRRKIAIETAAQCLDPATKEMLLAHNPWAIFIGTPKGSNHFKKRYDKACEHEHFAKIYRLTHNVPAEIELYAAFEREIGVNDATSMNDLNAKLLHAPAQLVAGYNEFRKYKAASEWFTYLAKASETGILDRDEIDAMVSDMDPEEVEQELECSWTAAIKGAIYAHILLELRKSERIGVYPYDPGYPVDTFWDLGMDDKTAIWFVQRKKDGNYYYIDYYEESGKGIEHYWKKLQELPYAYGRHVWPHDGNVKELGTGVTRKETASSLGLKVEIQKRQNVPDQIQAGKRRLALSFFNESRTARGIECLENYQRAWDSKRQIYKETPEHDWSSHGSSSFNYSALENRVSMFSSEAARNRENQSSAIMDYNEFV